MIKERDKHTHTHTLKLTLALTRTYISFNIRPIDTAKRVNV